MKTTPPVVPFQGKTHVTSIIPHLRVVADVYTPLYGLGIQPRTSIRSESWELTFKTREEYREFRAAWRMAYKKLSELTRAEKMFHKQAIRKWPAEAESEQARKVAVALAHASTDARLQFQYALGGFFARQMMEIRKASKLRAGELRAARLAQEVKT